MLRDRMKRNTWPGLGGSKAKGFGLAVAAATKGSRDNAIPLVGDTPTQSSTIDLENLSAVAAPKGLRNNDHASRIAVEQNDYYKKRFHGDVDSEEAAQRLPNLPGQGSAAASPRSARSEASKHGLIELPSLLGRRADKHAERLHKEAKVNLESREEIVANALHYMDLRKQEAIAAQIALEEADVMNRIRRVGKEQAQLNLKERRMLGTIDAWLAPKTGVLTPRANGDEEDADAMKLLAGLATNEPEPPSKAAPHGPTPPRQKKVKSALSKQLDAAVPMNVDSAPGAASRERRKSVESLPESPSTTPGIVRSDSRRLRSASHS